MEKHYINKTYNGHSLYRMVDQNNPLNLPPYTMRLRYMDGFTPTAFTGSITQVSSTPNIWDFSLAEPNWHSVIPYNENVVEILGGNTTNITSMSALFYRSQISSSPLFDTSTVTNFGLMFYECPLTSVPLFDLSNATDISRMFLYCRSLKEIPLFNTSSVTGADSTFYGCSSLETLPDFDLSNVGHLNSFIYDCSGLTALPNLKLTNVTSMRSTFANCYFIQSGISSMYNYLSTKPIEVTYHSWVFDDCGVSSNHGGAELALIPSDWK